MKNTVICTNGTQFKTVAAYYDWESFDSNYVEDYECKIYIDNKPNGYDKVTAKNRDYPEITFKEWQTLTNTKLEPKKMKYTVEVTTDKEAKLVIDTLELDLSLKQVGYSGWPRAITSNGKHGNVSTHTVDANLIKEYGPVLSFETWTAMLGVELPTTATLKLTSDYNAVVNYKTSIVQVGCQAIPFAKVEELHKLINQK